MNPKKKAKFKLLNWAWHYDDLYRDTKIIIIEPSNDYKELQMKRIQDSMKIG